MEWATRNRQESVAGRVGSSVRSAPFTVDVIAVAAQRDLEYPASQTDGITAPIASEDWLW